MPAFPSSSTTAPAGVTTDLASLADLKAQVNIAATDTSQDVELQSFLDAATAVIENITGPMFSRTVTESHSGNGNRTVIVLRQRPVQAVTTVLEYVGGSTPQTVTVAANPGAATVYSCTLEAETGALTRRVTTGSAYPWASGDDNIVVTYTAGFATVPANVQKATVIQAAHLYQNTQLGGRPSWAQSSGADQAYAGGVSSYAIPNYVRELLDPHQRIPGFA